MMSDLDNSISSPQLIWVIEPEHRTRFRYESEGGSHGGLAGKAGKKTYPTLKLVNYQVGRQISVRVSLYTEDKKKHVLEFKGKKCEGSKRYIEEKLQDDNKVVFKNLQIVSKKKHEIVEILEHRISLDNDMNFSVGEIHGHFEKTPIKERAKVILNSVRLYFEAFEANRPDVPLCTLFSDVICNQKAAAKGDLRICHLSCVTGSWKGGDEVVLLCEKIQKENIKIRFYEMDHHGNTIWQEYGCFSPADVHYQVAIPFKTPPYRMNVKKNVFICLERDGEMSEPREFTYLPEKPSSTKRKKDITESWTLRSIPSETLLSSKIIKSSQGVTSVEPISNVEMQSASTLQSYDSNQFEMNDGMSFNAKDSILYHNLLEDDVLKDEDYSLPFENLINSDDLDISYTSRWQEQNQSLDIDMVKMTSYCSSSHTVESGIGDGSSQSYGSLSLFRGGASAEPKHSSKRPRVTITSADGIINHKSDIYFGINSALTNKSESESKNRVTEYVQYNSAKSHTTYRLIAYICFIFISAFLSFLCFYFDL